jgi:hypothetical protein
MMVRLAPLSLALAPLVFGCYAGAHLAPTAAAAPGASGSGAALLTPPETGGAEAVGGPATPGAETDPDPAAVSPGSLATDDSARTLRILKRRAAWAQRWAKINKYGALGLSLGGLLGGAGSFVVPQLTDDPEIQKQIGQIGGLTSGLSSGLGLLFGFQTKAGKAKDCTKYLTAKTAEFEGKWGAGVAPDRVQEYLEDKKRIAAGHDGKCRKINLR